MSVANLFIGVVKKFFVLLLCFIILLINSCSSVEEAETYTPSPTVRFIMQGTIPLVLVRINGKRAYFIVDTGASVSILNEQDARYFGFRVRMEDKAMVGFGGMTGLNRVVSSTVEIGALTLKDFPFACQNLDHIAEVFEEHNSIKVAGVIGSDVFRKYGVNINYRDRTLSY